MASDAVKRLLICCCCGTQYDTESKDHLSNYCKICNDPRGFVPPPGQQWTTLAELEKDHHNKWVQEKSDPRIWSICSEPKVGIGERALLIQTPSGNILWDLVPYIDNDTVNHIQSLGGLSAIVLSHPYYYTTMSVWSSVFECPVYTSIEDGVWLEQLPAADRRFIETEKAEIVPGVTAIKTGGHFEGSLLLHWEDHLFHADTFLLAMSGLSSAMERVTGRTVTYSFMYSPPNMLPLAPAAIQKIWTGIKPFEFKHTHGAFPGQSISGTDLKERLLQSMRIFVRHEGYSDHEIFIGTDQ